MILAATPLDRVLMEVVSWKCQSVRDSRVLMVPDDCWNPSAWESEKDQSLVPPMWLALWHDGTRRGSTVVVVTVVNA